MAATVGLGIAARAATASRATRRRRERLRVERPPLGHVVARGEDLVPAEDDRRRDVGSITEFGCGENDFAVHLPGHGIRRRAGQQQRGDARMLVEDVKG